MPDLAKLGFPVPSGLPDAITKALTPLLPHHDADFFSDEELHSIQAFQKAANYLTVAQIYLKENVLLQQPLSPAHLKPRLLGHFGTTPGLIFAYAHVTLQLLRREQLDSRAATSDGPQSLTNQSRKAMFVTGPGHGAPGILSCLYLEGTLARFYPDEDHTPEGVAAFVKKFSWPGLDRPSHLNGSVPGVISEGGELGYSLGIAYGAVMDKADLIAVCVVGDGEAETGPTSAMWHAHRYIDPSESGAVLPILHLNKFKIAEPTIFGTMDESELLSLFTGYGFQPVIVSYDKTVQGHTIPGDSEASRLDLEMASALDWAWKTILEIQYQARSGRPITKPRWPMIILISPKGWGGPISLEGKPIENSFRSHQVPIANPHTNKEHLQALETWLKSYEPHKWFRPDQKPFIDEAITAIFPKNLMGQVEDIYQPSPSLEMPDWRDYAGKKGTVLSEMDACGEMLKTVTSNNRHTFRIFSPDELISNHLGSVLDSVTTRNFQSDPATSVAATGKQNGGRVIEMLSEHTLQAFAQGYTLMGGVALFPSYESFLKIVTTMIDQYAKFLKNCDEVSFRPKQSSITYIETSHLYRQEHNGSSHQNPGLINSVMDLPHSVARIYFPPDANTALSTLDHCLRSRGYVNLIVGSKHPSPVWLSPEEAHRHCVAGASVWKEVSTDEGRAPDVVLVGIGVELTSEVIAARDLLARDVPSLRVRMVNITDLLILSDRGEHPHSLTDESLASLFTVDKPVVINFHGFPSAIKGLLGDRLAHLAGSTPTSAASSVTAPPQKVKVMGYEISLSMLRNGLAQLVPPMLSPTSTAAAAPSSPRKVKVLGYVNEGTTTTPWSMLRMNGCDRFSVASAALSFMAHQSHHEAGVKASQLIANYQAQRRWHEKYVIEHGKDPDDFVAVPTSA
ncbi:hypothetical protein OC845_000901 [Tilletia horrida]|nr:hypothetical protein OC845_000901 [Tilletia horrida]